MINQEDQSKLKQIYQRYSQFHGELNSLENQLQDLLNKQIQVSQELENTRKNEKLLINKIEEDIQRTLTQDELIKIVNS